MVKTNEWQRVLTIREDGPHLEVGGGEADDGGLVELRGDGGRQGKHLGELVELAVLLLPSSPRCILTFLFHDDSFYCAATERKKKYSNFILQKKISIYAANRLCFLHDFISFLAWI